MKYKSIIAIYALTVFALSCERDLEMDSVAKATTIPEVINLTNGTYVFGLGSNEIFNTIPDTLGIIYDSVYGFEGGFGGKTGKDSAYLLKSEITGDWPDTTVAGATSITAQKFNLNNFKNQVAVTILVVEPNENPGATDLAGTYKRTSNGYLIEISKISDGVYFLDNPGGAGVDPHPYVLKNYKDVNGVDSLSFEIQENPCGGGLQLIGPAAPTSGTSSADYSAQFPPQITSKSPLTLSWIVMEFDAASPSSTSSGGGLCQWGAGVRTFQKQ
jgi:hypothetical protein